MSQSGKATDNGLLEKQVESASRTSSNTAAAASPSSGERKIDDRLFLNEQEAWARARQNPSDSTTIWLTFSKDDPDNPRNWGKARKWWITCFVSFLNVATCIVAGSVSSGAMEIQEEFGVDAEITTLLLAIYVLGFAVGPMLLAPLSEYFGRNPVYLVSWFLMFIFELPLALAPNIGTLIVCRFLSGFFGSAPLTNTGGTVSDLWTRDSNGYPMCIYGLSSTFGPPLALVISGYIALNKGWRWVFWVDMIITGGLWVLLVVTIPETRHSIILDKKAKRLAMEMRKENLAAGDTLIDSEADEKKGLHQLYSIALTRPFRFLFTEPITLFSALYNGFIYALVYIFNEAFPLVFGDGGHGFNTGEVGLSFLGLCVGSVLAAMIYPFTQERHYQKEVIRNNGHGVPEARMWSARYGAFLLPISLFWFAWTSFPSVHWIVPIIASAFFSAGIYIVILSILNYVVDSYQTFSASSLAGVILVRNLFGAGFPLFATQMYQRLGNEWATTLLAFLSILMVPIPWLFYYKGETIRLKSPWARQHFAQDTDATH